MKQIIPLILFSLIFFNCKRNEPADISINQPNTQALEQISAFKTSVPEPSGLTYNSKNNSLLTVSDANSTVYEINFTGQILKSWVISSSDLEGIAVSKNCDTFYVADEANQLVSKYLMNGNKIYSFPVKVATDPSKSIEGITIDNNNHLFVVNEKSPCMLLEFVGKSEVFRKEINYTSDCSDIFYDSELDCLWIISDESSCIIKITKTGNLLARYSLPFTKGEGLTIINDKIYIVNDSDGKLYIFKKP